MPVSVKPKAAILQDLIATILAHPASPGIGITDITPGSTVRTLLESQSNTLAEQYYALYTTWQSFFLSQAIGADLDARGTDLGLRRDAGQAASGDVVFTRLSTYLEDIALVAPQTLLALLADGSQQRYRTLADGVIRPNGRSISAQAPALALTMGINDKLQLNLDGDGPRLVSLGTLSGGATIAAAIQTAVRALTANDITHQLAYDAFRCDYSLTTPGAYTLRSGTGGPTSSVVVTPAPMADASVSLKLGLSHGGTEQVGEDTLTLPVVGDTIGVASNIGANQITTQAVPVTGIANVTNPLAFANGREPASDDAYRQDIRAHLLALGRGTPDALERAVLATQDSNGHRVVLSAQALYGPGGNVTVFVADGQSTTLGAQATTVALVQAELEGRGQEPGGWLPSGVTAVVVPATIRLLDVAVTVLVTGSVDVVTAQQVLTQVLTRTITQLPIGQHAPIVPLLVAFEQAVTSLVRIDFSAPAQFAMLQDFPVGVGEKLMPGALHVVVQVAT